MTMRWVLGGVIVVVGVLLYIVFVEAFEVEEIEISTFAADGFADGDETRRPDGVDNRQETDGTSTRNNIDVPAYCTDMFHQPSKIPNQ